MSGLHARHAAGEAAAHAGASHQASGTLDAAHPRYCPVELLASFALLMAGHGRCVNTDMMLGDRDYAMAQLAGARAMDDPELAEVTTRLVAYFEDARQARATVLGTA